MAAKNETAQESVDGPYYLENVSIPDDSEDDYQYEEVLADGESSMAEEEEDLETAVRALRESSNEFGSVLQKLSSAKQPISHIPEVVDDFLRNFLVKMGMTRTLDCFQAEWYEMLQRGLLKPELVEFVPDAYTHNQLLDNELKNVQRERDSYRKASLKAADTMIKLQKERDFHRLQHKRVVQEKNRLVEDIKRLKKHYESYEPALKQLSDKYQVALKQKMLISLERDRAYGQANSLEATLRNQQRRYDFRGPSFEWRAGVENGSGKKHTTTSTKPKENMHAR
uniref:Sperm-associated antigen 16 protein n=1 Tax=Esox lucius TaxID=8010 RepID=A0AAY5KEJ5_ESOLU